MYEKFLLPWAMALGAWAAWAWWNLHSHRTNRLARPGTLFVCPCCGKRSRDRNGTQAVDHGWDSSCRTWAALVREDSIELGANGRVARAVSA